MIQLTFGVAWEVCAIGEPYLNWQSDTGNKVWSDEEASGRWLASSPEDHVVWKGCFNFCWREKGRGNRVQVVLCCFFFLFFFDWLSVTFPHYKHQADLGLWCMWFPDLFSKPLWPTVISCHKIKLLHFERGVLGKTAEVDEPFSRVHMGPMIRGEDVRLYTGGRLEGGGVGMFAYLLNWLI